jgi:hypothetical protein
MGSGRADLSLRPLLTGIEFSVTRQWRHLLQVNCFSGRMHNKRGMQYSSLEFVYSGNALITVKF